MRMKESVLPALARRKARLSREIEAGLDDPERFVFIGSPITVRVSTETGELSPVDPRNRMEGPAEAFGLGYAMPMRTDEQAAPLLRHIVNNLEQGGSDMARRMSARLAKFARARQAGPRTGLSRGLLRESDGR